VIVSYMTKPKPVSELAGLVYGATELPSEGHLPLYKRPITWACIVIVIFFVLNIVFW